MASEGSPDPSAATLPAAASAAPTASDSLASAESYLSPLPRHELRVESTLDSLTDPPKTSHIRYRYTKEQMYAIAASKAAQIKPPRLPSIVCRDEPGNLADHREIERERARERRADKLGPPPGLAPPTEKRGRDRNKAKAAADATSSWKDRPEGAPASADGDSELESLRPAGSKQFPSSQLGKANPIGDGTKAKPAARTADGRAAGRAERGAAKREDPRLRNRKDRETFGFDVSSPLEPATLEGLSAASARDPEEVRRFAAVSNESFDAAPEPFALAADGAPDAVLLSDMLLMERKLATTAAEPSAAAGEDSRFGRWFEARESPPVRASSLLAAVAPTPPPTEPAAKPHVDAAVVSFSAASVTSVYAAAPPSSASVSVPASAPSAPVSSASDQRTQRAAPVAAPSQPTAAPSLPPSSSSSAPASAAPSVAPTTAPAPAPAAQHASHSAPTNSNSGFPAPSHSHELHAPPPHASHYEPSSPSSFPLPQMPRPPTADGSSFPLPQLSAMPPSTFTSNALLSLLRQGEQQRGPAPPMAKGGAAPPPQKSGEAPMAYHPSYGMHPSHMQMMPPPYAAQPPPMHAGQMQSAPPHLGHPHSHLGPRPPTHTPLPPPAGYAPPNYPPASKGAAAGAPPPGMMKGPAPYMAPPYANAPPPGKMPPGYGPEAGYYYGPPQQAAPQQGGPRQPFPQGPPQPHGAPPPAGAGLERWFGQMAVAAPPRPTGPVQMKSLDEIESQLSRQQ